MWLQHPISHILRKRRPSLIFGYSNSLSAASTTYTFSTALTPFPRNDRKLIIGLVAADAAADFSFSGVTVDGVAATEVVDSANASSLMQSAIYIKDHPGGESASIVITMSEAATYCGIHVYCAYGLSSNTPVATATAFHTTSAAITLSIKTPPMGIVFGMSGNEDIQAVVWTGLYNVNNLNVTSSAHLLNTNAEQLHPITVDWAGAFDTIGVSASFR